MATLRNQAFVFDKDDLTPKCGTVLEILQDLVKHFQEKSKFTFESKKMNDETISKFKIVTQLFVK
jgi:hypothetical protein